MTNQASHRRKSQETLARPLLLRLCSALTLPRPLLGFGKDRALRFTRSKRSPEGPLPCSLLPPPDSKRPHPLSVHAPERLPWGPSVPL